MKFVNEAGWDRALRIALGVVALYELLGVSTCLRSPGAA